MDVPRSDHRLAWTALGLALVAGAVLRLGWIEDMEWKGDERWTFEKSRAIGRTESWPAVGMATSLGFPNPGLSLWSFVPPGRLAADPPGLASLIGAWNVLGLVGFAAAIVAFLPARSREPWLWGIALNAVNPYAVRLSRKIWPPSILTPFVLVLWVGHLHRRTRWGAFIWGLVGALLGQIHLSGWFLAVGIAVATAVRDARVPGERQGRWGWWLLGSALGMVGLLPWILALRQSGLTEKGVPLGWPSLLDFEGIGYLLFTIATGVLPSQGLGLGTDTLAFEVSPVVGGLNWHVGDVAHLVGILAPAIVVFCRLGTDVLRPAWRRARRPRSLDAAARPAAEPSDEKPLMEGDPVIVPPSATFYVWAAVVIPSVLLTLVIREHFRHYYFVLCPFLFVGMALLLLPWRRILFTVVVTQAVISGAYLLFLHQHGGARGDYGPTYARQSQGRLITPPPR